MAKLRNLVSSLVRTVALLGALQATAQATAPGRQYASPVRFIPCGGSIMPTVPDLKWKPKLSSKPAIPDYEGITPDNAKLDSLTNALFNLKVQYRKDHPTAHKTTTTPPDVVRDFPANLNDGETPLDNTIAISNNGVIVNIINSTINYYDTLGNCTFFSDLNEFLGMDSIGASCDPEIYYDAGADRFIFVAIQFDILENNRVAVCFSKSGNPLADGWWKYQFTGDPYQSGLLLDYPKLGYNDSEFYISGNMYDIAANQFSRTILYQCSKLAGYAGEPMGQVFYDSIAGNPFTLMPISAGGPTPVATGMHLVCTNSLGGDSIHYYHVTGNWCCSPYMTYLPVHTLPYVAPSPGQQMGTSATLDIRDCRTYSGFVLDSIIHFVFHSTNPITFDDQINYNRLNLATMSNMSRLFGLEGADCAYPAVASLGNAPNDRSVTIGYGLTGPAILPEIMVVNCSSAMYWSDPVVVKNSVSYNEGFRYGDYTGIARKQTGLLPEIWMSGMFSDSVNQWDSWISEVYGTPGNDAVHAVQAPLVGTHVFPNPIRNTFKFDFTCSADGDIRIDVTDAMGNLVKELYSGKASAGLNTFSFDKSNLRPGNYLLSVYGGGGVMHTEKVVVVD
jgi:Secretion system C-terminal sorting domain